MSKDNKNSIHNDTLENQYEFNDSKIMEIWEIIQSNTIGKLKYYNVNILDIMGDDFQDKLIKMFCITR